MFAKGKYFVEMIEATADPAADDSTTMRALATAIDLQLPGSTMPPTPLQWFPQESVAPIRMVPESVLGLHELERGYVARYSAGQAFIVVEDALEMAVQTLKSLRTHFPAAQAAQIGDEAFQANVKYLDGLCIFRKGRIVGGYSNLLDSQQAAMRAAVFAARIPQLGTLKPQIRTGPQYV
jgi:hypothetical protein